MSHLLAKKLLPNIFLQMHMTNQAHFPTLSTALLWDNSYTMFPMIQVQISLVGDSGRLRPHRQLVEVRESKISKQKPEWGTTIWNLLWSLFIYLFIYPLVCIYLFIYYASMFWIWGPLIASASFPRVYSGAP